MLLAVISPAKKQHARPLPAGLTPTRPRFGCEAVVLMKQLAQWTAEDLMKRMKISRKLADLNVERNRRFSPDPTLENSFPAGLLFQGDTYVGLESHTLSTEDWLFAQGHLAILSGLYGLLSPLDLVQPHRLEMGTRLPNPWGETLYAFWEKQITEEINRRTEHAKKIFIINLASQEYFKSIVVDQVAGNVITPDFKEYREGKLKTIGTKAKRLRGKMARHIITHRLTDPEPLKQFSVDGYHFQSHLSHGNHWVFVAEQEGNA